MHNEVRLIGTLKNVFPQDKEAHIAVPRRSGIVDTVRVLYDNPTSEIISLIDKSIKVKGYMYTCNKTENGHRHLNIYCKGTIVPNDTLFDYENEVEFIGYLVKPPVNRDTPSGKTITELHVAINDGKLSYYIPVITFDRVARRVKNYCVGSQLSFKGRFQSRDYQKQLLDGTSEIRTAYEIAAREVLFIPTNKETNDEEA